ncbi:unnamed protein product [Notodromas monacha]|uniref:Uncharacterized protein n=1 Tax=Notodromas monacha TaxID=399045 RepID=A0A7R9C0M0_9CRUS|nr:unnamed protein product [Notodromas monacha]CAG0925131.1 unnamed protein product [Notodromas monacha]
MSMFLASVSELIQLINDIATTPENFRPNSTEANTELPFVIIETEDLVQETSTVTTKKPIEHMNIGGLSVDYISDSQVIYEDDGNAFQPHNAVVFDFQDDQDRKRAEDEEDIINRVQNIVASAQNQSSFRSKRKNLRE